jgi:hypothetical protein
VDDPEAIAALRYEQRGRLRRLLKGGAVQADVAEPEALPLAADF